MRQNKNVIIAIVSVIVVLAGMFWVGRPAEVNRGTSRASAEVQPVASSAQGKALRASETFFDFGKISMAAGVVAHTFTMQNTASAPLVLKKLYTSCMCTTASIGVSEKRAGPFGMPGHGFVPDINLTIAPGETAWVEVVFDPAAHGPSGVGQIDRVVYLESASGAPFALRIAATVTP